ncbi:MAG: right-handed parallel beta-helix repeat-containing protein, partial [Kiritimatiellae bacterium]|nr:right-handed parallel beta-helix repeat-containing protein [Kiritimatiellia bacterium]
GTPDNATVTIVNSSVDPYTRYVTTAGNDANDGFTIATAKATLQAAIDSLDAHSQEHDCTVYVAPGTYVQPYNDTYCVYVTNRVSVIGMTGDPSDVIVDRGSTSSAIFCVGNQNAVLRGLTVVRGYLDGGKGPGVYLSSGAVEDCVVSNCTGNAYGQAGIGVYAEGGRVSRCRIAYNKNNNVYCFGVGIHATGSALVEDCLVDHNTCHQGGAVNLSGSATFLNCTVVKNTGSNYSGVRIGSNTVRVVNCAIFGNTVDHTLEGAVYSSGYGACFDHCAADLPIEGGVDCLFVQPVFRDVEHGDYRPAAGSPLLDAGAARSDCGAVSTTDFDGLPRENGTVDIGCFENAKDTAECGFTWSANKYILPVQVTLHADSFGVDSPSYVWTFHNENTGTDVAADGKDAFWDLAETDAGTYTLSLAVGGVSYTSPEKLVVSGPVLYALADNADAAFPYDAEEIGAPNVATALAAAGEGSTIYVLPGEYPISSQIKVTKGVRILGAGETYRSVVVTNTANSTATRVFALQHPDAFVANLTMAGGRVRNAQEGGNLFIYGKGGTVSNCLLTAGITYAQYQQGGGAATLRAGTLTHCEITRCNAIPANNQPATRVLSTSPVSAASPVRISNCLIHDCDATEGTNATRGKGSLLSFGTYTTIENCTVADCTVVAGATSVYLGVLQSHYDQCARLINCAVFVRDGDGAVAPLSGGTAWGTFWPLCVYNCASESEIGANITSNNGKGWYYGADCIVTTPDACFQDVAQGDFRLKEGSPLVDAGIDNEGRASIDFSEKKRKVGKFVDIGCYELPARIFAIIVR